MNCPECKKRMIFDRELKDYYCESCKLPLRDLKEPRESKEESTKSGDNASPTPPMRLPDVGSVKGVLFIMIGSIIQLISPFMAAFGCQIISIIGLFLFILGLYMLYQDRKRYSKAHISNIKFASIILIAFIISGHTRIKKINNKNCSVIFVFIQIYSYSIQISISDDIDELDDEDIVPKSSIQNFFEAQKNLQLFLPITIGLLAIFQFLAIKELIEDKYRKILIITVIALVVIGFGGLYSIKFIDQQINYLEDTKKSELMTNDIQYNITELEKQFTDTDYYINYGAFIGKVGFDSLMVLCYFWTYSYQKNKQQKLLSNFCRLDNALICPL
jgi:4-hydroxybenzoate polyprenyltransferase